MKELKEGPRDLNWLITKLVIIFTLDVFPLLLIGCAAVIGLVYVYVTLAYGFVWLVMIFCALIVSRIIVRWLIKKPRLGFMEGRDNLIRFLEGTEYAMGIFHRFLGRIHVLHGQFVKFAAKKFMALPTRSKVMTATGIFITLLPISFLLTISTVNEIGKQLPYGKKRFTMSAEELAERKVNRINMAKYAVWGKENVDKSAKCMNRYKDLLYAEAGKRGLTPERVEGQLFVESFCNPDALNGKSGAAGFSQIMLDVACERGLVKDSQFCQEVLASEGKIQFVRKDRKIVDLRYDTDYAIPTAAAIMSDSAKYWGQENWAFVQYHMGQGNLRKLVIDYLDETSPGWRGNYPQAKFETLYSSDPQRVLPKAVAEAGISYDDIFFRCNPADTPKTFKRLYKLADSSATYVYTGLAAVEGFRLMRSNPVEYAELIKSQQTPDGETANRPMRVWWPNDAAKYDSRKDIIIAASNGALVQVASNPGFGFNLRTKGADRVGECDPGYESSYYYTRKATMGLIFLVGSRAKELGADNFDVTGLVRTNEMYDKLVSHGHACLPPTQPRTHVIGSAFDIGANINGKPMSQKTRDALEFVYLDLRADGVIDRIKEGSADHIAYNPQFEKQLEAVYDEVMSGGNPLIASR